MARSADTRDVEKAYGSNRLESARAFLRQARQTETTSSSDRAAAVSSAILSSIAASDAVCALRLRQVWKGDHSRAHTHLRKVKGAEKAANALQRVVGQKTNVQYLAESVTVAKLAQAVRQAETVLEFAEQVASEG